MILPILLLSVLSLSFTREQCSSSLDADVLILGGGMAGTAAANKLQELGRSFLLFEAQERLGGRMQTTEIFPGISSSVGPLYIQGVDQRNPELHPIFKLMQVCGELQGRYIEDYQVFQGSEDVTAQYENRSEAYYSVAEQTAALEADRHKRNLADISYKEALRQSGWIPESPLDNLTEWLSFDFYTGEAPEVSSLASFNSDSTYTDFVSTESAAAGEESTDYLITDSRGYVHLVNCLATNFSEKQIHLNSRVTKILNSEDCVCIEVVQSSGTNKYCGRYAILTFSIGVIKSESFRSVLSPFLSQDKQESLKFFHMVNYLKIYLKFNDTFWDNDAIVVGRVDSEKGNFPVFTNVFPSHFKATIFVLTGDFANKAVAMDIASLNDSITEAFRAIYGNNVTAPTHIFRENYLNNPLFLGSFVGHNVGYSQNAFDTLKSPQLSLHFAGGAFHKYFGYVHGAYLSGINTAEEVNLAIQSSAQNSFKILHAYFFLFIVALTMI